MHYHTSKLASTRVPLRKMAAALLENPPFPAWIDAATGVPFSTHTSVSVTPRVRDSLVLRLVAKRYSRNPSDVRRVA
jgi:hypothetical protein